jgi:hypothetical protein
MAAVAPDHDAIDLSALQSIEEVIGYVIAAARAEGEDEVDVVELLVRATDLTPDDVRQVARLLRSLGYVAVADMLRKIAGRRRHSLALPR